MIKETMTPKERTMAAIKLEPYDRVPVAPLMDVMFPSRHKGMTVAEGIAHPTRGFQAIVDTFDDVGGWDAMILPGYSVPVPPHVEAVLQAAIGDTRQPGKEPSLDINSPPQFIEKELLTVDDYDDIANLGWAGFCKKHYNRFLPAEPDFVLAWAKRQIERYKHEGEVWAARGIPSLAGAMVMSPLMFFSTRRSLVSFTQDLYRCPDKVQAAMDAMVDELIQYAIEAAQITGIPGVELILERGGCFYYPLKIFERFEFRYMKKMINAFSAEGLITVMHFDQDWTLNLPYLLDLPKKMCVCELDSTTDIFKAKEILKDHMCIMGDVPASLSSIGTTKEMQAYCEKLIDHIGKGKTGFILSTGCTIPSDTKFENFQVMINSVKEHAPQ
jgi:uroporphyrinogen-III decarboxylase